jgi:hypothetical protein
MIETSKLHCYKNAMNLLFKLVREPVVILIIIGILLYAALDAMQPSAEKPVVEIRPERVRAAIHASGEQSGRKLQPDEIEAVVNRLVGEELMLAEAYAMGLDKKDPAVRERLIGIMRTPINQSIPEPTPAQLEQFYRDNTKRFVTDEAVAFDVVFFNFSSEKIPEDPNAFLEKLERGEIDKNSGDYVRRSGSQLKHQRSLLTQVSGAEFVDTLFQLSPDSWHGPIRSKEGWNYVRVQQLYPSVQSTFEEMRLQLPRLWRFEQQQILMQKNTDALRSAYTVLLPEPYAH